MKLILETEPRIRKKGNNPLKSKIELMIAFIGLITAIIMLLDKIKK